MVSTPTLSDQPVLVDFESRGRCDLKARGGRNYWQDPAGESEAICAVLHDTGTGKVWVWEPGDRPPSISIAVAHNAANFDRFAAEAQGWQVDRWIDSSHAARRAGLPGALDALATRKLGRRKDLAGSKYTKGLSRPSRRNADYGALPELTPAVRERVIAYCADDVSVMSETWDWLSRWVDTDADVAVVDQQINDRGMHIDLDLVRTMQRQIEKRQDVIVTEAARELGVSPDMARKMAKSPQQFCAATGFANARKETYAGKRGPDGKIHPLVRVRTALASIVPGKLRAVLGRVSPDSRLRDSHYYYGAHTGRWSSKGLQHHNLPRVGFEDDAKAIGWHVGDYIDALIEGAHAGSDLTKKEFDGLMRAIIRAAPDHELAVLDYAGIEARGAAWAAGDTDALRVFTAYDAGKGPDPYRVMAGKIFSLDPNSIAKDQRNVGKAAELGCGYQMGAEKFQAQAEKAGTDLRASGVSSEKVVKAWRALHRPIVKLWHANTSAFAAACEGHSASAGRWTYEPINDSDVACFLPSGRPIVYCDARAKRSARGWELSYQGHRFREHTYGGSLLENAIQALSRDLLADALIKCEARGLNPVIHVHDEVGCEVRAGEGKEALAEMKEILEATPEWAEGMPVVTAGFVERMYRK